MSQMTRLLLERSLTARDFCVAMWCASKAGLAEAVEHKKDPTSQSGKFHDHLPQHLPNCNTDHLHDLHTPTFNKKTPPRDEHRLSVAPPHECLDDDVENDGQTGRGEEPEQLVAKVLVPQSRLGQPHADGVPCSHGDSVIGLWVANMLTPGTLPHRRSAKEVAMSMQVPWLVHILSTLREAPVELLCHGRRNAPVKST